jgi:hypothetical protein
MALALILGIDLHTGESPQPTVSPYRSQIQAPHPIRNLHPAKLQSAVRGPDSAGKFLYLRSGLGC